MTDDELANIRALKWESKIADLESKIRFFEARFLETNDNYYQQQMWFHARLKEEVRGKGYL